MHDIINISSADDDPVIDNWPVVSRPNDCNLLFVELCSGSGKLSSEMRFRGFTTVCVDWIQNKHRPKGPTLTLDLSNKEQTAIIIDLIRVGKVFCVWAAVPCGTASRARDIPMGPFRHGPAPLRSQEYPLGLPNLSADHQTRVAKANDIYLNVIDIVAVLRQCGGRFVIENPRGSYLWDIPHYRSLLKSEGCLTVDFQHCRWSTNIPSRCKWTRLATNVTQLQQLQGPCNLPHQHLKWGVDKGVFDTAGESEYPSAMCAVVAEAICLAAVEAGYNPNPVSLAPKISDAQPHKRRRAVAAKQPRGFKLPPVIPEFGSVEECSLGEARQLKGKILRFVVNNPVMQGDEGGLSALRDVLNTTAELPSSDTIKDMDPTTQVIFGRHRTPEEFFDEAVKMKHPLELAGAVPDELARAASFLALEPEDRVAKHLIHASRELIKLAHDTRHEDDRIIQALHPRVRKFMEGKKMATLQKLATMTNFPDKAVVRQAMAGFELTGMAPYSDTFDFEVTLPTCSTSELRSMSELNNSALISRCRG